MTDLNEARRSIEEIDKAMADLFTKRMKIAEGIAEYKRSKGIPVLDEGREKALIEKNEQYIEDDELKTYYRQFIKGILDISKQYQSELIESKEARP